MAARQDQLTDTISLVVVSTVPGDPAWIAWLLQAGYQPRFASLTRNWQDDGTADLVLLHVPRVDASALRDRKRCGCIWPGSPVALVVEEWTPLQALHAMRQGAWDCLQARNRTALLAACRRVIRNASSSAARLPRWQDADDFTDLAQPAPPPEVRAQLRRCAAGLEPLVLVGEPGTEKQDWAHWMHLHSERKTTPFLPLVQPALDPQQLVQDLSAKIAWTATLFLPDLQQCPLEIQALLASMLSPARPLDEPSLRAKLVVGLTTSPVLALQRGHLHPTLLPRLHQVVELPPLRDRIWQLPALVQHCLREVSMLQGGQVPRMTQACWRHLQTYAWPGNFDELRQVVRAACARAKTHWIREEDLPASVRGWPPAGPTISLAQAEECLLRQTLELHRGNKTATAAALGISRRGLYKKLQRLQQGKKQRCYRIRDPVNHSSSS